MREFSEMSKEKQFSEDYYPHAQSGIKIATIMYINLERTILFLVLTLIFKFLTSYLEISEHKINVIKKSIKDSIDKIKLSKNFDTNDFLFYIGHAVAKGLMIVMFVFTLIFAAILIITLVMYIVNVIKRQRNYERSVIKNDLKAYFLKRKILAAKDAKVILRDEKRAVRKKREGDSALTKKDKIPLDSQKEFMKMIVMINSRESLDNKGRVDTQYRIMFNMPNDSDISEDLDKRIENINDVATKQLKAKVTFGKKFDLDSKNAVVFRAWDDEADKYLYNDIEDDDSQEDDKEYHSSYPLSMLNDKQDEIDEKHVIAEQWTKRNLSTVKAFLATSKIDCTFKNYEVGNKMASYVFVMADDVTLPQFDKLGDTLDNMMKKKGSDVTLDQGNLVVSIPLVKEAEIPINVPTMYRDIFG